MELNISTLKGKHSNKTILIDTDSVSRIRNAYISSVSLHENSMSPLWQMIVEKSIDFHADLIAGKNLSFLDSPGKNFLFYGFDNLYYTFVNDVKNDPQSQQQILALFFNDVITLAEAVGVKRIWNPEGGALFPYKGKPEIESIECLLDKIEDKVGFEIDFPNPFPDEFGILTSRGIISQRAIPAIYQAYRLKQLSHYYGNRILELGAGLGRTAYYSKKLGLSSYAIVDLPQTNVSQANFLIRLLGDDSVCLFGEDAIAGSIKIMPPSWIEENIQDFDIVLNADSLTEMDDLVSSRYLEVISNNCKALLSINHEANMSTVGLNKHLRDKLFGRFPYSLRKGYLEEIFIF